MAKGIFGEIQNGEYTLNNWVKHFNNGYFNGFCRDILIEMGGYDWWGTDKSFYNKIVKDLAPKVTQIAKSSKVNGDTMYVFFKENCPCVGPTYCDFRICDIETGNVLFCIGHLKSGCYGDSFSGWEVYDMTEAETKTIRGNWNTIKAYFEI